jgi:hypothetical protein
LFGKCFATSELFGIPEALTYPKWKVAIDEEYSAVMTHHMWHLVLPSDGNNVIDRK